MPARIIFRDKYIYADKAIREMIIWRLPYTDSEPYDFKYLLMYGYPGKCLVRYDDERGKGDHRHDGDREEAYTFIPVEQLIQDFKTDIEHMRGEQHE